MMGNILKIFSEINVHLVTTFSYLVNLMKFFEKMRLSKSKMILLFLWLNALFQKNYFVKPMKSDYSRILQISLNQRQTKVVKQVTLLI